MNSRKLRKKLFFFSAEQSGVGLFAAVFTAKEGGNFTLHVFHVQQSLAFICFFPTRCTWVGVHTQGVVRSPSFYEEI